MDSSPASEGAGSMSAAVRVIHGHYRRCENICWVHACSFQYSYSPC